MFYTILLQKVYQQEIKTNLSSEHVATVQEACDLFVFITYAEPGVEQQNAGISWKGSICYGDDWNIGMGAKNGKGYRVGINSWISSDFACAKVSTKSVQWSIKVLAYP